MKRLICIATLLAWSGALAADGYLAITNNVMVIGPGGSGSDPNALTNNDSRAITLTNTANVFVAQSFTTATGYFGAIVLTNVDGSFWTNLTATNLTGTIPAGNLPALAVAYPAALTNNQTTAVTFGNTVTMTSPTIYGYLDAQTNGWTTNTAFPLGFTNLVLVSGANTACGVTGILNAGTATERWGQLLVIASGDIVFTNPASIHASDYLTSRTITNANNAMIAFDVWPGLATNMFISQTK